jgi:hypothetical protein
MSLVISGLDLYAFDLIEHDGEDIRNLPLLDRKAALARLLRNTQAGTLFNEHIVEDGPVVFAHACRLGPEGIVSKRVAPIDPAPAASGSRSAIPPASPCSASGARFGSDAPVGKAQNMSAYPARHAAASLRFLSCVHRCRRVPDSNPAELLY